ncbi:SufE family protein [Brachybacterium sp. EF45031]|nr:SufE family protein [Brachybacterium sillae]MCS6711728.1 SufE family protein [Brachybacterium sillae]
MGQGAVPAALQEIADDFTALPPKERLQLLLEFSDGLPELPERYADHPELLEPVPECQSPIFLITEVEGTGRDATAHLFFSAPPEAPTTRGFAGILAEGLDGLTVGEVLDVPGDVTERMGLAEVVSPLRLRGMAGMLGRIKRQLREKSGA